jgi:hypothetical protein
MFLGQFQTAGGAHLFLSLEYLSRLDQQALDFLAAVVVVGGLPKCLANGLVLLQVRFVFGN